MLAFGVEWRMLATRNPKDPHTQPPAHKAAMPTGTIRLLPVYGPASFQQTISAVAADTTFTFGRHYHDQFGLGLIRRGAQTSASGRGPVEAVSGNLITVNPGEVHDGSPCTDSGRAWHMLYLDPAIVTDLLADTPGPDRQREFTAPVLHDKQLAAPFLAVFTALTRPDGPQAADPPGSDLATMAITERLIPLLTPMLTIPAGHPPFAARRPHTGILRARTRIDDDPAAPLSVDDLAAEAGMNRFHLIRAFRGHTGLTPHAYLVQQRILKARRMIMRGTPLAETALACGFADQSHLTRQFVRTFGLTPGTVARAARQSGRVTR